ncbi:MAG: metallophosphoesterase [Clostridiales bacterium]|nr:metallophosphoesterase [Clostridiales bacterium]
MHLFILIILIVTALLCLTLLILAVIEPRKLVVTHEKIGNSETRSARILFFSDLHAEFCFIPAQTVIGLIEKEKPDAVIFGGDIINDPLKWEAGQRYLLKIRDICAKENIPFAGVTGNHDVEISPSDISACGFINLWKQPVILQSSNGRTVGINGITDSGRKSRVWYDPKNIDDADITVTVAHNPDAVLHLDPSVKTDLILSGHIHKGQIRTPMRIEFTILRADALPQEGIISGLHTINGRTVFISSGIGCVKLPLRLGAPPEVNIIDLYL